MIESKLRDFIIQELAWNGSRDDLTYDYPLIERRVLDSLGIFQVVTFVETEYGIDIQDEELVPEHFGTIDGIARLIESKQT